LSPNPSVPFLRRRSMLAALALAAPELHAAAIGAALDRRALDARAPSRSVLLCGALAGQRLVAVGERGLVVLSDDAGRSWRQASVPASVTLTAVRFFDARRGYAAGHGGVVLRSTDGGQSWERVLDGRTVATRMLEEARSSGDARRQQAALRLVKEGADKPFLDLLVIDDQTVVVVGAYGLALATKDAGKSWTSWDARIDNPKGSHLYSVRASGPIWLIAGEQGLVLRSEDAGATFQRVTTPYQGSFFTAELRGTRDMVVAGLRGNIWRSSDAGANWSQCQVAVPATITASVAMSDGTLLLANQAGQVLAGPPERLAPLKLPPQPPLNGLLPLAGGQLLTLSDQGVRIFAAGLPAGPVQ